MFALPLQVAIAMRNFKSSWFIVGGWAIDLFLGKITRPHQDIEIAIFRKDQAALHEYFADGILQKVVDGKQFAWKQSEWLRPPIHEIHCYNETGTLPHIEILLNESNETEWLYRRNLEVRRLLSQVMIDSSAGVKFLCPEVVLLYKSKNSRIKDEQDFQAVIKYLNPERKQWLKYAIGVCEAKHRWLRSL